jgi:N-acetylmuramoyl-L-alanine amidase
MLSHPAFRVNRTAYLQVLMIIILRAAAFAAAAFTIAGTAVTASPALAMEGAAKPIWARSAGLATIHIDNAAVPSPLGAGTSVPLDSDFASPPPAIAEAEVAEADSEPRTLSELVEEHASSDLDDEQLECLAGAVYFESKGEPLEGQLAVAEVVINRANSGRYPSTYCGVVTQKSQFSFVRGGRIPTVPRSSAAWAKAVAIAQIAANDLADSAANEAMFFHANYVRPSWRGLKKVARVGNHIFYR